MDRSKELWRGLFHPDVEFRLPSLRSLPYFSQSRYFYTILPLISFSGGSERRRCPLRRHCVGHSVGKGWADINRVDQGWNIFNFIFNYIYHDAEPGYNEHSDPFLQWNSTPRMSCRCVRPLAGLARVFAMPHPLPYSPAKTVTRASICSMRMLNRSFILSSISFLAQITGQ